MPMSAWTSSAAPFSVAPSVDDRNPASSYINVLYCQYSHTFGTRGLYKVMQDFYHQRFWESECSLKGSRHQNCKHLLKTMVPLPCIQFLSLHCFSSRTSTSMPTTNYRTHPARTHVPKSHGSCHFSVQRRVAQDGPSFSLPVKKEELGPSVGSARSRSGNAHWKVTDQEFWV